mmetsp:Transcript_11603/g.17036  ORF Transcript_11603/g.17036 Transcript_11603/m.17036 type:complete len:92 (-) Transcript_11603:1276-1551(-)
MVPSPDMALINRPHSVSTLPVTREHIKRAKGGLIDVDNQPTLCVETLEETELASDNGRSGLRRRNNSNLADDFAPLGLQTLADNENSALRS